MGLKAVMSVEDKPNYIGWVLAPVAAVLLYVLSVGPVGFIVKTAGGSGAALREVYAPVVWLGEHTLLKRPLHAYTDFWGI